MKFKIGNILRTNNCLEATNNIIINKTIKPLEYKKNLLDKPFNEFFINTSHNTYIPCIQNFDVASCEAIKRTLLMGARVIELDCFAKDDHPIVAHGIEKKNGNFLTTSYLLFEDCIDTIFNYGFLTSDPLIISLELNTNKNIKVQKKMKEIIRNKLGDKLLNKEYKIGSQNKKSFTHESIKKLLNKVIFVANKGITDELNEILDGHEYNNKLYISLPHTNAKSINTNNNIIKRIYPAGNLLGHLSYNFDPVFYWKKKCQMVAMNFQVIDDNLLKNIAMFKDYSFVHFSEILAN